MKSLFHTSVPQKKAASFQAAQLVEKGHRKVAFFSS